MEIRSIRHKGLLRLFERNDGKGLPSVRLGKIRNIITALANAEDVEEIQTMPGWRLHPLKGGRRGTWAISLTGNWRITFQVMDNTIYDLDLEGYH